MAQRKPKPYFPGQLPAECGCYYPDVSRVGDSKEHLQRLLFCRRHGFVVTKVAPRLRAILFSELMPLPEDRFRKEQRHRIRQESRLIERLGLKVTMV